MLSAESEETRNSRSEAGAAHGENPQLGPDTLGIETVERM
ncbi:hypothetical protein LNP74_27445 [Klebsiella pneumoniae subsp. pneumoniae]|nr:hypothetical protein [Klebsiella pneumoniae subsp. pneumoniae]